MHIAICDDNVADRKQLERLLKREADKRLAGGSVIYVDSFGHPQNLLQNSMQYDAFFIDICKTENLTGVDVVNSLTAQGNTAPVILCSSAINYRTCELPARALFLDKPIKASELSLVLDEAQKIKDSAVPLIELREDKGTFYVTEADIMYAVEEGRTLYVTLTDGKIVQIPDTAMNFFFQIENYPSFFSPGTRFVVNARYISNIHFHRITMSDGRIFKASGRILAYAKIAAAEFKPQ